MKNNTATQETSRESYHDYVASGMVSQRVTEVLLEITEGGPMNQTMAFQAVIRRTGKQGVVKDAIGPRFATLERMGLIRQVGTYPCPVTKRSTVFYEATKGKATCTEKEANNRAGKRALASKMMAENAALTVEVKQLRELLNLRSEAYRNREERIKASPVAVQGSFF